MILSRWIAQRYGRKLGLAQHLYHLGKHKVGLDAAWQVAAVEWTRVERVVFVCAGNILRSPYAEACGARRGARVISFGLQTQGGDPTPALAVRIAAERGVDLSGHRSRSAENVVLSASDLVVAMEPQHAKRVRGLGPEGLQIVLLGLFGHPVRPFLQDPYGLSEEYLRTCFEFLDGAVATVVAEWTRSRQNHEHSIAAPAPRRLGLKSAQRNRS